MRIKDLNQHRRVLKKEKDHVYDGTDYSAEHLRALKKLKRMPHNEHVLPFTASDAAGHETMTEEVDLKNVFELMRGGAPSAETLAIIRDCLDGARALAAQGLVLQDIQSRNLGSMTKDGHRIGVLYDLEGLYPKNTDLKGRIWNKEFTVPEVALGHVLDLQPEEMTYQFGRVLEINAPFFAKDLPIETRLELARLAEDMMAFDPKAADTTRKRIDLATALARLDDILQGVVVQKRRTA